jgi:hypothetical protein
MILLVFGGRDFSNRDYLFRTLDFLHARKPVDVLIEGEAPGADRFAGEWADERGVHCARVKALWGLYGRAAGPKRNEAMKALKPDLAIAFPGGTGTAHMAGLLRASGVQVLHCDPAKNPMPEERNG